MLRSVHRIAHRLAPIAALLLLVVAMQGTWSFASPASAAPLPSATPPPTRGGAGSDASGRERRGGKRAITGTLNLNTATIEELVQLPTIGPAKAERIIAWRKKHGPFRRPADLRRVKGFGYKTFKRLEPHLTIVGTSTLAPK